MKGVDKGVLSNNKIEIIETQVEIGSGSLPTEKVPSIAISIKSKKMKPDVLSKSLRSCEIPVLNTKPSVVKFNNFCFFYKYIIFIFS